MAAGPAVLLGGSGFVGRVLAHRLLADATPVRVVARHAEAADLPTGAEATNADVRDPDTVRRAVQGATSVVYLPGIVAETGGQRFRALHVEAPRRAADLARAAGVRRFVFVSALGAARDASAEADRSKAEGERAVLDVFPRASVLRPSLVFGPGDHFVTGTARMLKALPVVPAIGGGATRFQPVHVDDLAAGLAAVLAGDRAAGRVVEAAGPETYTFRELLAAIRDAAGTRCWCPAPPDWLALALAAVLERLPGTPLTRDQVRLMKTDKVATGGHLGLADLGVTPRSFGADLEALVAAALGRT